jgi:hypothetical protein
MASQDEYGAAVHEAGHVVVAWARGLKTRRMPDVAAILEGTGR